MGTGEWGQSGFLDIGRVFTRMICKSSIAGTGITLRGTYLTECYGGGIDKKPPFSNTGVHCRNNVCGHHSSVRFVTEISRLTRCPTAAYRYSSNRSLLRAGIDCTRYSREPDIAVSAIPPQIVLFFRASRATSKLYIIRACTQGCTVVL